MLYYFSGTGNSLLVCQLLSKLLGENYSNIVSPQKCKDETIGIVFPVYAWGMPFIVKHFIRETLPSLIGQESNYVYIVMTCGDDVGYTDRLVSKTLKHIDLKLSASFSLQMPNTYVSLPGFDVDSDEIATSKIIAMRKKIPYIAETIRKRSCITKVTRGNFAWLKSTLLRVLFSKLLMSSSHFHISSSCICCGKCARHCPVSNISMQRTDRLYDVDMKIDFVPVWGSNCEGCLGCYHVCPKHAVRYGWFTKNKGQKRIIDIKVL